MAAEDKQREGVEQVQVLALAPSVAPWERHEGETDKAFEAFTFYRDAAPTDRSLTKTSRKMNKSRPTLADWSRKYGWVRRVSAWDDHCDAQRREAELEKRRKMGERHAVQAANFQKILMEPARALAEKFKDETFVASFRAKLANMKPEKLLAVVRACAGVYPALMRSERLASGESTENVEGRIAIHTVRAVSSRIAALAAKYVPQDKLESFLTDLKSALANELGE